MTREQAANVLGVPHDADPSEVRRAWRIWARLAHPDAGGSPEHFRRLAQARDALLDGSVPEPLPMSEPEPRAPLRRVCVRPTGPAVWSVIGLCLLAVLGAGAADVLPTWAAALVMGSLATAAAVILTRRVTTDQADVGHRITLLTAAWVPLASIQVLVAQVLGASVLTALPALALPFAAAVALVNPGAGLWRPIPG